MGRAGVFDRFLKGRVKAGRGVYFCTLAELITSLAKAEREGGLRERLRFLCRPQLLIVD